MTGHSASGLVPDTIDSAAESRSRVEGDRPLHGAESICAQSRAISSTPAVQHPGCRHRHQRHSPQPACAGNHVERCADDVAAHGIEPPALVVVGDVVLLRPALDWISALSRRTGDSTMTAPGLILAAPASGSGKTVTVLALLPPIFPPGRYRRHLTQGRPRLYRPDVPHGGQWPPLHQPRPLGDAAGSAGRSSQDSPTC